MNSNKIYTFFIVLFLLFWNPLTYQWIYSGTAVMENRDMWYFITAIFITGLAAIYGLGRNWFNERLKNALLTLSFTGILFAVLVMFDGLVGWVKPKAAEGLIFEPNSEAHYRTAEFDVWAKTNSLGLRNEECRLDKGENYRILCFGDSWTFGWGVNLENSWPKQLEQYLKTNGVPNVEAINCGQGGQHPSVYRQYMEKTVPLLKPNLVLVGLLEGDDLAQLYEKDFMNADPNVMDGQDKYSPGRQLHSLKKFFQISFANILSVVHGKSPGQIDIKSNWEKNTSDLMVNFSPIQRIRYESLDDSLQHMFQTGNVNPAVLRAQIQFPERLAIFNEPKHPATRYACQELDKELRLMKSICEQNNCSLAVITMPVSVFSGHQVSGGMLDHILGQYLYENNRIDSIYRSTAVQNNLLYMELTQHFKNLEDKNAYFFHFDGHPNKEGYAEIGCYVGEQLLLQDVINPL